MCRVSKWRYPMERKKIMRNMYSSIHVSPQPLTHTRTPISTITSKFVHSVLYHPSNQPPNFRHPPISYLSHSTNSFWSFTLSEFVETPLPSSHRVASKHPPLSVYHLVHSVHPRCPLLRKAREQQWSKRRLCKGWLGEQVGSQG